jgi:hypothetical protein
MTVLTTGRPRDAGMTRVPGRVTGPAVTAGAVFVSGPAGMRGHALALLRDVLAGAAAVPVGEEPDLGWALAQVTIAARHHELVPAAAAPAELAGVFQALLAHRDLPSAVLAWVAADETVNSCPGVLAALLEHPNSDVETLLAFIRSYLWKTAGRLDVSCWRDDERVRVIAGHAGLAGLVVAELLPVWGGRDFSRFSAAVTGLCTIGPAAPEIFRVLAADALDGRSTAVPGLPEEVLDELLEKSSLLGDDTYPACRNLIPA